MGLTHHVVWRIEIDAGTSPEFAARKALATIRDPETQTQIFEVFPYENGKIVQDPERCVVVDLCAKIQPRVEPLQPKKKPHLIEIGSMYGSLFIDHAGRVIATDRHDKHDPESEFLDHVVHVDLGEWLKTYDKEAQHILPNLNHLDILDVGVWRTFPVYASAKQPGIEAFEYEPPTHEWRAKHRNIPLPEKPV